VISLIVTRHVEPAAYVQNPKVPFTLPYQLREVLQNPIDPVEGPAPAGHPRNQQTPSGAEKAKL
jgi:hypothetical protein